MNFLSKIPRSTDPNVRLFYFINAGLSVWFVEAVWYFYWARFADYSQIGLIFAVLTAISILMEVPSGAFADLFGRKLSTVIGCFGILFGSVFSALAQDVWYLVIGGVAASIGRSFISGSLQALVYDDLKKRGEEKWFDDVISASVRFSLVIFAATAVIGGFLYSLHFRLAHLVTIAFHLSTFIFAIRLREVVVEGRPVKSFRTYLVQNLEGFRQLANRSLRPYLISVFTLMVVFYVYDWGLSKPAMAVSFGYGVNGQAVIYTLMALANAWLVGKLPFFRKKVGDFHGILLLHFLIGLGFVSSFLGPGRLGLVVLFLIEFSGALSEPWISTVINRSINSQDRATTLSSVEFISKLPFLALVALSGSALETQSINVFHLVIGLIVVALSLIALAIFGKSSEAGKLVVT